jgi:RimJ/RimL family protein N-acetyltransferase
VGRYQDVELDHVEITGDRLLLRRWQPADADAVFAIMRDESMYEFLALPRPYTHDVAREFVGRVGHEGRAEGTGIGCAVVDHATGRLVGSAALRHLDGRCDIGYWVAPAARGHGYAAEATRLLAGWAFEHGVHRVELLCDVRNIPSICTALAAGFGYEGVNRGYDCGPADAAGRRTPIDVARFARLRTDSGAPMQPRFPRLGAADLTDDVIVVRPMTPADEAGWTEQELDELTLQWAFAGEAPSRPAVVATPARAGLDWVVGTIARFTIEDVASGRYAGTLQLRVSGPPQVGGIGYAVHPAFRGRGYTTRALRLLVTWAFDIAGFVRLELGAKTANVASQKAAAAAGFAPDGVRAQRLRNPDGTFSDEVRYVLLSNLMIP